MTDNASSESILLRPLREILASRPWRFLHFSFAKAKADHLDQQSAALSFTTIVSLIPLLASFSFLGARWFDQQQDTTIQLLTQLLPFSEETIATQLQTFLDQAQAIRGLGFALFLLAALSVFTRIEHTINTIWNIPTERPLRRRLLSFTLIIFWGPVVIGATYYLLFQLRQQSVFPTFGEAVSSALLPFIVTLLGLTMLYWHVPYTTVQLKSALSGGLIAALSLELLRTGFGFFVDHASGISLIYGSFGLALLFMISIQLTWWIILLGSEAAYCMQHFSYMEHSKRPAAPAEGSWLALLAMALLTDRFRNGHPVTPHEFLADMLQVDNVPLRQALEPLISSRLLGEIGGDDGGYMLGKDPHEIQVSEIFDQYEPIQQRLLSRLPEHLVPTLQELRQKLDRARSQKTRQPTLAALVSPSKSASNNAPAS